jgi:hypothetical protein
MTAISACENHPPVTKLCSQEPVLFNQVRNRLALPTV